MMMATHAVWRPASASAKATADHRSLWQRWLAGLSALVLMFLAAPVSAQTPAFDSSKAWEHLRQQVAIGPRPSGSPANVKKSR